MLTSEQRAKVNKQSNRKGREFNVVVAKLFTEIFGVEFMRTPRSGGYRTSFAGDILKKGKKETPVDNAIVEAKNEEAKYPVWLENKFVECEEEAKDVGLNNWLLVMHRPGTTKNVVAMPDFFFKQLMSELQGYRDADEQ